MHRIFCRMGKILRILHIIPDILCVTPEDILFPKDKAEAKAAMLDEIIRVRKIEEWYLKNGIGMYRELH